MTEARWNIAIDTGGTFTDVVATDPSGTARRRKILSDASIRAEIALVDGDGHCRLREAPPDGLLRGAELVTQRGQRARVLEQRGDRLRLDAALALAVGETVELRSQLEAPALAAHWITATAADATLPPMQLRLATTRGTNALLERQGARCAMLLTEGLEDLLLIGTQQRPELFARVVRKAPPFAERFVGVTERCDFAGEILEPLDEAALQATLRELRAAGFDSIGIALLHATRNPEHEETARRLAEDVGFACVSVSSQLSARQGYLERARSTEINAYLKPTMNAYLSDMRVFMPGRSSLWIMSSAGELLAPDSFEPKDSLLSGPAGGAVGAAACARALGIERALAFDMGGTSTDVSRIEGQPETTHRHRVGDAELLAAAVDIESVAAGGGSICWIQDGLPQVGPQSAGAHPGPACYGAGGELAITDVNLLLGRIRAERFPFRLDTDAARQAAETCLRQLSDRPDATEVLLEGFLRVANERMAEAIRRVTLRRGQDPRDHTLIAFGGAGGQHACAIAELLDLARVVIPPEPSLLSAVGVATSPRSQRLERQILLPLNDCMDRIAEWIEELRRAARDAFDGEAESERLEAELRFVGQESAIDLSFDSVDELEARFLERYESVHLHRPQGREIELLTLRVVIGEAPGIVISQPDAPSHDASSSDWRVYFDGTWMPTRVVERAALTVGDRLEGPALIEEAHSVFVLAPGWSATVAGGGAILAQRNERARLSAAAGSEAIERQLFHHRFEAIAKEMGERLRRAAVSTNVKEREDFSCAVLDPDGRLVVNAPHIPVHLGALGSCVRRVRETMQLREGDFVLTNHPAFGGSHLPDLTLLAPVYDDQGELLAHVACRAHHAEIGGIAPGSMPATATRLSEEGVVLAPLHVARDGTSDLEALRKALTEAPHPTRALEDNLADVQAMFVACRRGVEALRQLALTSGADVVRAHMEGLAALAAQRSRLALSELGDGSHRAQTSLDDGTPLRVEIRTGDGGAVFDFTGSAPTHPGNLNATEAVVTSCVLYVLRLLAGADLPFNEGLLQPVRLVIPRGILSPDFDRPPEECPAIVGGNVETSQILVDLMLTALSWSASSQGTMNNLSFGNENFGYYETLGGGVGAGADFEGESAVHCHMTNTRITDVEVLEHRHPVRARRFSIRQGSGGRGIRHGGDGLVRELEFLQDVRVSLLTQRRVSGPPGVQGGIHGAPGRQRVLRSDGSMQTLGSIEEVALRAGDRIIVETPGGGGWGKS